MGQIIGVTLLVPFAPQAMFVSMDKDGNGELSCSEIIEGLKLQGVQVRGVVRAVLPP